ncbi:MAG: MGDG synthase family glycosyltransferase [Luteolibacter sp.]
MTSPSRILITTAAFGEGHNSAARNLALALDAAGAETSVVDPCLLSAPHSTAVTQWGYRLVTTSFPKIWEQIYIATDKCDFSQPGLPFMRPPENYLAQLIETYDPTAIVSTYPIYPYFLHRIFNETSRRLPVFTVVTDSIEINASWLRAPTDYFLVTDQTTLEIMRCWGIPEEKIIHTGFPVNPAFTTLTPISADAPTTPFKVLYFATARRPHIRRHGRAILDASPDVHLTIVMGKNFRALQKNARELKAAYPGRVHLLGWTKKVPTLLNKHHLVIGKAGGATVHEAIAARCPMLIHHLVPGQEEGNLKLLQQLGAGDLAETPEDLKASISNLLANNARKWRAMKTALATHNRNDGSIAAADFILTHI